MSKAVRRTRLRTTSGALFPAALRPQEPETAFQRMVKAFGDAVTMQEAGDPSRTAGDGQQTVAAVAWGFNCP